MMRNGTRVMIAYSAAKLCAATCSLGAFTSRVPYVRVLHARTSHPYYTNIITGNGYTLVRAGIGERL